MENDKQILEKYVQLFEWGDDVLCEQGIPLVEPHSTDHSRLEGVYSKIKGPLPQLYEKLLLSYRWYRADFEEYCLLANPPGEDFSGLLAEIFKDECLSSVSLQAGYLQLAFGPHSQYSYDPICFDTSEKKADDWPIVRLDHEDILCKSRCRTKLVLAPNFRELVINTIAKATNNN